MFSNCCLTEGGPARDLSDTFNGLMMIPNLIGVVALLPLVLKVTKNYVDRKIKHKDVAPSSPTTPRSRQRRRLTRTRTDISNSPKAVIRPYRQP